MSIWNQKKGKNSENSNTSNKSSIGTGHEVGKIAGFKEVRESIKKAMVLDHTKVSVDNVLKTANEAGQIRSYASVLGEQSKQQQKVIQGGVKVHQTLMNHALSAARAEVQYESATARGIEGLSETMLKLGVERESHDGYTQYNKLADGILTDF